MSSFRRESRRRTMTPDMITSRNEVNRTPSRRRSETRSRSRSHRFSSERSSRSPSRARVGGHPRRRSRNHLDSRSRSHNRSRTGTRRPSSHGRARGHDNFSVRSRSRDRPPTRPSPDRMIDPIEECRKKRSGKVRLAGMKRVYIKQAELHYNVDQWRANPKRMARVLFKIIVGENNLYNMSAKGRGTSLQPARPPIPEDIYAAVESNKYTFSISKLCTKKNIIHTSCIYFFFSCSIRSS